MFSIFVILNGTLLKLIYDIDCRRRIITFLPSVADMWKYSYQRCYLFGTSRGAQFMDCCGREHRTYLLGPGNLLTGWLPSYSWERESWLDNIWGVFYGWSMFVVSDPTTPDDGTDLDMDISESISYKSRQISLLAVWMETDAWPEWSDCEVGVKTMDQITNWCLMWYFRAGGGVRSTVSLSVVEYV